MKLIKKLGSQKNKTGNSNSWGLFLCCYCKKEVERQLESGKKSKSCGCVRAELSTKARIKHGDNLKDSPYRKLYAVWLDMKSRCHNEKDTGYQRYGGRGIFVCAEWKDDYSIFKEFALSKGWNKLLQIDRIDNDGNYESGNCRFVTRIINQRNRPNTKLTMEKTEEIREKRATGIDTYRRLAEEYSVGLSTITHIIYNESWKEL